MPDRTGTILLGIRSLLWMLLLPGVLAGFIPWRYFGVRELTFDPGSGLHWLGGIIVLAGIGLLGACVWQFAATGRGTLSPLDPPRTLVTRGLYRYVRNPMYLAVTLIILGQAVLIGSRELVLYWLVWFVAANLFVRLYEEPALRRKFGAGFDAYAAAVPRWIPRLRPYQGGRALLQAASLTLLAGCAGERGSSEVAAVPSWSYDSTQVFPADRSLVRPEDGVALPDGRLIVADQVNGLRLVETDGTSRPFGNLIAAGYIPIDLPLIAADPTEFPSSRRAPTCWSPSFRGGDLPGECGDGRDG